MEVILKDCSDHPSCPHGPCLLFERHSANSAKSGRKFYACSACRDRSVCSYFQWVEDELSAAVKNHWKKAIDAGRSLFTVEEYMEKLSSFQKLPVEKRKYCKTCSVLILQDFQDHKKHETTDVFDSKLLLQPSILFQSFENNKSEAQYFFSEKTVHFVTTLLRKLNYRKLVLIGAPKIHEYLALNREKSSRLTSFLLDIDPRYKQFFGPKEFCHYNLFNNHFFDGEESKDRLKQFLNEKESGKVAVLLDPPFGGLVDAISFTLRNLNKDWQLVNNKTDSEMFPVLWFFPYFMEKRIVKNFPEFVMTDYKVDYQNHKKFGSKAGSKGSPVRIFTNIESSSFVLPAKEGYRFCKKCNRSVSEENQHCDECNACTTKHGKTYHHCKDCGKCVKNSYVHCKVHNVCSPPIFKPTLGSACKCSIQEPDSDIADKCFKCFGLGHRKRDCPMNTGQNKKMKK